MRIPNIEEPFVDAGPDGLPPHDPDDSIQYKGIGSSQFVDFLLPPGRPSRMVDVWGECDCCGGEEIIGTRRLSDKEYSKALAEYERAMAEWKRTGGRLMVRGPVEYRCTITSADGELFAEYAGNGETWKLMRYEIGAQTPKPPPPKTGDGGSNLDCDCSRTYGEPCRVGGEQREAEGMTRDDRGRAAPRHAEQTQEVTHAPAQASQTDARSDKSPVAGSPARDNLTPLRSVVDAACAVYPILNACWPLWPQYDEARRFAGAVACFLESSRADPEQSAGETSGQDAAQSESRASSPDPMPVVVTLCGSTRFYWTWQRAIYDETMAGHIVLSVGFYPHSRGQAHGEDVGCTPEQKTALDELHKRRIDLSGEILVLDVGGYVGESTRGEIEYAERTGKRVRYWSSERPGYVESYADNNPTEPGENRATDIASPDPALTCLACRHFQDHDTTTHLGRCTIDDAPTCSYDAACRSFGAREVATDDGPNTGSELREAVKQALGSGSVARRSRDWSKSATHGEPSTRPRNVGSATCRR